ncbi:MAG: cytochrome c3 family protein [Bacteroidales bacterium]|nr:cytochrome c3 family protein [Bacteroidales bacterium]
MKNSFNIVALLVSAVLAMASCEGPMGPAGADGAMGDKGDKGDPGTTLACAECHNSNAQVPIFSAQWSTSTHAIGGNAPYANRTGCVQCHTSQGFLEALAEGSVAAISLPEHASQITCYTCHNIHKTFSDDDWSLTKPGAQTLDVKYAGADVIWNKGTSNQCVFCHQSRNVSPAPVVNGPDFTISSTRIGPHHGPNANLILGKTPFELPGTAYPANVHSTAGGCVTCHMSTPYGYQAGGHNMSLKYDSHGTETRLLTGCTTCHEIGSSPYTAFNAKITESQNEVKEMLEDLEAQLIAAGIYNSSTELARTGTFKANAVLAYLNYNTIKEDRSLGIHNPEYIKTLLGNSIAAMTALGYPAP